MYYVSIHSNLYKLHNVNVLMFMLTLLFLSSYSYFLLGWIKQKRRNKLEKIHVCLNIICIYNTIRVDLYLDFNNTDCN